MDLNLTPQEDAFRDEVRAFLATHMPPDIARKFRARQRLSKAEVERWQASEIQRLHRFIEFSRAA